MMALGITDDQNTVEKGTKTARVQENPNESKNDFNVWQYKEISIPEENEHI